MSQMKDLIERLTAISEDRPAKGDGIYLEFGDTLCVESIRLSNVIVVSIVKFILKPPFSKGGLFFYRILANAAIATIDEPFLTVLGLKKRSKIWLRVSRKLLDFLSYMLGHESPSQKIARARIQALQ